MTQISTLFYYLHLLNDRQNFDAQSNFQIFIFKYEFIIDMKAKKTNQDKWCIHNHTKIFQINNIKDNNNNFKQEIWTKEAIDNHETTEEIIEEEEEAEVIKVVEEEEVNIEISKTIIIKIINKDRWLNNNSRSKNPIRNPILQLQLHSYSNNHIRLKINCSSHLSIHQSLILFKEKTEKIL